MIETWFSFWRGPALAATLLLLALSACGGGPGLPNESRGGFLPIPTMTPAPVQPTADYLSVELGEAVNVYEEFSLDGVTWIQLYERGTTTWILDPVAVRAVLALLNTEVTLEAWDSPIANQLILIAHWPPGRGPVGPLDVLDSLDFIVDQDAAMIAAGAVVGTSVLFPMPEGFLELLRASATATPTATPSATPTATPEKPCGDVNDDGQVNSVDANLILQLEAGFINTLPNLPSADVNGDGVVNSLDSNFILQFVVGFIPSLSC